MTSLRPAASARAIIETRLAALTRRTPVASQSLFLIGSWATNEGHVPSDMGSASSLSDVDLISETDLTSAERDSVRLLIQEALASAGLRVTGVSIRSKTDFIGLPHARAWSSEAATTLSLRQRHHLLAFWSAVGGIEAAITLRRTNDVCREQRASYGVAKFFFTYVRNAALCEGQTISSYRALSTWAAARSIHADAVWAALGIKLGVLNHLDPEVGTSLLDPDNLRRLTSAPDIVLHVSSGVLAMLTERRHVDIQQCAEVAARLADCEPLRNVVQYELAKFHAVAAAAPASACSP